MTVDVDSDLRFHVKSLSRLIYVVTDEEDQLIIKLSHQLKKSLERTWVYNSLWGMRPILKHIEDWTTHAGEPAPAPLMQITSVLEHIYKVDPQDELHFYIITEAERWLKEDPLRRRLLNIIHQVNNDISVAKVVILVGATKYIPRDLQRYIQVVQDPGPDSDKRMEIVQEACSSLDIPSPTDVDSMFRGLTSYEMKAAISQSIIQMRGLNIDPPSLDPKLIADFRRRQIAKTDLVQQVDVSNWSFSQVGGAQRFKDWCRKTKAAWSPEGRAFGLEPPRGVLLLGIWGCGKSLSVKAMGQMWGLPVVQLEMGKLRSNQVGESEANIYRAIRIIESASPCIVWMDEAEKSLAGLHSSSQSDAGITSRVLGIFSTWLQETTAPVCFAMTANNLSTMPVEFINRMDERFFFTLPTANDRVDILKIHLLQAGQNPARFDLVDLADKARDMVGREIKQAIKLAMTESYDQRCKALDPDILENAISKKPRIIKTMADEVNAVREWVGYDAEANDGIRARYASDPESGKNGIKFSAS